MLPRTPRTSTLARWLDVRPGEGRTVALLTIGAFLLLAALTLARALREALYLERFGAASLPYITVGVVILSIPLVAGFVRLLGRLGPRQASLVFGGFEVVGLVPLWLLARDHPGSGPVVVGLYLWTALGILALISAFWLLAAERLSVRGAKRLYGVIGAGGTAGATAMGVSLSALTGSVPIHALLPFLMALLAIALFIQRMLPSGGAEGRSADPGPALGSGTSRTGAAGESIRSAAALVWKTKHLRLVALLVMVATMASTIVDFQFKEHAQLAHADAANPGAALTGFLGAFYGWTGALALLLQLLVAGRLLRGAGVGRTLSVLPTVLLLGSVAFALAPSFLVIASTRGADASLRRSLFRPAIEFLHAPLPDRLRRRTKAFLDSFADGVAEALGAGLVFVWITLLEMPSRGLSLFVAGLAVLLVALGRAMDRQYLRTLAERLHPGERGSASVLVGSGEESRLLSVTFTRLGLGGELGRSNAPDGPDIPEIRSETRRSPDGAEGPRERLRSPEALRERLRSADAGRVREATEQVEDGTPESIALLIDLLARDSLLDHAVDRLASIGGRAVPLLRSVLSDESADFVVRRRIPAVLARVRDVEADDALLEAIVSSRFEVRYRAVVALGRRRRNGLPSSGRDWRARVWEAIEAEVTRDRAIWEMQRILDRPDSPDPDVPLDPEIGAKVGARGRLSLEHTFRMLGLVLDPGPVRAAFHGIAAEDPNVRAIALEYLEQVLPPTIRTRIWLFIGDPNEGEARREERPIAEVVSDLLASRATLFGREVDRAELRRLAEERDETH